MSDFNRLNHAINNVEDSLKTLDRRVSGLHIENEGHINRVERDLRSDIAELRSAVEGLKAQMPELFERVKLIERTLIRIIPDDLLKTLVVEAGVESEYHAWLLEHLRRRVQNEH